ncbi:MAG: acetyl-CoA carboxylase biotin carboxyl carrier protein subunit [Bacteroidetes bacterium]|jgi:biotin carboxyl carrier protein|nr:acetyl-CoA carboxylase biotin carboxyl carrier protein subunit [Bacteroidota bacterium]
MYTATVNNTSYKVEKEGNNLTVNGEKISLDTFEVTSSSFHILKNNVSYNVDVIRVNKEEKTALIRVNGNKYEVKVTDKFDELLKNLGMDSLAAKKVNNIKAPMPGLVLNIIAKEGDTVKKGDPLLVLEAMKMENILKSPTDGVVKRIAVTKGIAVEKNQLLIEF